MASTDKSCPPSTSLLRRLLPYLSQDWLTVFFDLFRALSGRLKIQRDEGLYEILDYVSILELKDTRGKTAIFKKQQKVKFIQDHIIAFQDYAWGDGDIFAMYHCSPGMVVDRYQEGDHWNILISLHETKHRGDIVDFYIERTAKNGFLQAEESFQTEIRHPTRRLKVVIIFPKDRRTRRAVLLRRSQHQATVLGPEHFADLPDGRQQLTWETRKIKRFEIYTIKWSW